jgi:glycosyltransferase involved in cell wall biosynthesis
MKILFYQTEGRIGGAEMSMLDVLAEIRRARPDWPLFVVLGAEGPIQTEIEAMGVGCEVVALPGRASRLGDAGAIRSFDRLATLGKMIAAAPATLGYVAKLRRAFDRLRPDLIQTNGMKAHVLAARAARSGTPILWHIHDYVSSRPIMSILLNKEARRRAARGGLIVITESRSVAADAERSLAKARGVLIRAIHNAVDVDRFSPGSEESRVQAAAALDRAAGFGPAPEGTVRVGLIATYAIWKGHEVFLEAASMLDFSRPIRLYIIGGPIYRSTGSQHTVEALRDRIDVLGLRDRVGLTGHIADPAAAIRGVDVVVHASVRPEPFGRVIVEGMACGKAVIVSVPADDWKTVDSTRRDLEPDSGVIEPKVSASGATELFRHGIDAFGVPAGDPSALAAAIDRLASDHELRNKLANEGRRAAIDRFDRRKLAEKWLPLYDPRGSSVP